MDQVECKKISAQVANTKANYEAVKCDEMKFQGVWSQ